VRLGSITGLPVWGRPRRALAGRDTHHAGDAAVGAALRGSYDYSPIFDREFVTYCPNCERRIRIAL